MAAIQSRSAQPPGPPPVAGSVRCRLCTVLLSPGSQGPRAAALGTCDDCAQRPEARRAAAPAPASLPLIVSRSFTVADKSLIRKTHGFMPPQQLLDLLNERLKADLPKARPYTMAQLDAEIRAVADPETADNWAGLRKVLAQARRAGVLAHITPQLIDDFAVVFSLTPAQVMRLKDIVLPQAEDARTGGRA